MQKLLLLDMSITTTTKYNSLVRLADQRFSFGVTQSCSPQNTFRLRAPSGCHSTWFPTATSLAARRPSVWPRSPSRSSPPLPGSTSLCSCSPLIRQTSFWWVPLYWNIFSYTLIHSSPISFFICSVIPTKALKAIQYIISNYLINIITVQWSLSSTDLCQTKETRCGHFVHTNFAVKHLIPSRAEDSKTLVYVLCEVGKNA